MPNKKQILHATQSQIHYKPIKSSLEDLWDSLANYYTDILTSDINIINNKFQLAKIELETNLTTYDLINKQVIETISVQKKHKSHIDLSKKLIMDCKTIIDNKIKLLKLAIKSENETFQLIKNYDCSLNDGVLIVFIENERVLVENGKFMIDEKCKPIGFAVIIEYEEFIFRGEIKKEVFDDEIETFREYLKEKKMERKYQNNKVIIKIERTNVEHNSGNGMCIFIGKLLKSNVNINLIFEMLICYLSRYFVKQLIDVKYEIVNSFCETLCDGLSKEFYCIFGTNILKVKRMEGSFKLYFNGAKIRIANIL